MPQVVPASGPQAVVVAVIASAAAAGAAVAAAVTVLCAAPAVGDGGNATSVRAGAGGRVGATGTGVEVAGTGVEVVGVGRHGTATTSSIQESVMRIMVTKG